MCPIHGKTIHSDTVTKQLKLRERLFEHVSMICCSSKYTGDKRKL